MSNLKLKLLTATSYLLVISVSGQISPELLRKFIADNALNVKNYNSVKDFYTNTNYKTAWIQQENTANRAYFTNVLKTCNDLALDEKDYQPINNILKNTTDSIETEIRITDAAIHFYNDIIYGNTKPIFGYNGLNYSKNINISALLVKYIANESLPILADSLSGFPEIIALKSRLKKINATISDAGFKEVTITSKKISAANLPMVTKLYQLGIIDNIDKKITESFLRQKIKVAQQQFDLLADGVLRSTIIKELNVPLSVRQQELILSINYYRWLSSINKNQPVIVVNIPAAYMKVYKNDKVVLEMRIIVGKKSTPTPTLASIVEEIILYPYWHVPYSIATKELLPLIKTNPGFINAGNFQVLNKAGKIMDPYKINWRALSTKNFPYTIRQSTGCDNALGLLKLNFYNPFGVYLHDTPNKTLFMLSKRYFSHGCMRMEKPMELGHLILKNNSIAIDTLEQKGCLRNQSPIIVKATEQMPVVVWYNPVGIGEKNSIVFYEDAYNKFNSK